MVLAEGERRGGSTLEIALVVVPFTFAGSKELGVYSSRGQVEELLSG